MAKKSRIRRHHTVPRFHLRGFASDDGMLRQVDLRTGARRMVSVGDANVLKNFYTVELGDGSRSDEWERRLADAESDIAPLVRAAISHTSWAPTLDERMHLATWIALQHLRGPDHRRFLASTAALHVTMIVGLGGLAYLRHAMSQGVRREVSPEEAEAVWNDIHGSTGPTIRISGREHLGSMQRLLEPVTKLIAARSWHRVSFARRTLAISDSPVALIPDDNQPSFVGVGLSNARAITVALDRHTLLWLDDSRLEDSEGNPSVKLAEGHNLSVVSGAERFVYTHPDDADPTDGLTFPRPERLWAQVTGGPNWADSRDRSLDDVLKQIAEHDPAANPDTFIADYTWPLPGYVPPATLEARPS